MLNNLQKVVKNMDSNTRKALTDSEIKMYREWLSEAEPYTDEEIIDFPFDSPDLDLDRCRSHRAKQILTEYGLI